MNGVGAKAGALGFQLQFSRLHQRPGKQLRKLKNLRCEPEGASLLRTPLPVNVDEISRQLEAVKAHAGGQHFPALMAFEEHEKPHRHQYAHRQQHAGTPFFQQ